jgi:hypothetical protein
VNQLSGDIRQFPAAVAADDSGVASRHTGTEELSRPIEKVPARDKEMALEFLTALDPGSEKFTFQLIGDAPGGSTTIFHGRLDDFWRTVEAKNSARSPTGVFVAVNETDFKGRKNDNVVRVRSLFVDADGAEQVNRCETALASSGVIPSAVVRTARGAHYYFFADGVSCQEFSEYQRRLIDCLGTDPSIKDLPRVMRLPGTLHLKDPRRPYLVRLEQTSGPRPRYSGPALVSALGCSVVVKPALQPSPPIAVTEDVTDFTTPNPHVLALLQFANDRLSDGLEADVDEIRSAARAIAPSAISSEHDWVRIARAFAREAATFPSSEGHLWSILDEISRRAPGYDAAENRKRWSRYIDEAFNSDKPTTIASLFHLARSHGWSGYIGAPPPSSPATSIAPVPSRAVSISSLPTLPDKREWLHGTDLIRGAVSLIFAPGARGKTAWLTAMALACASGRPLLGAHVFGGPLKVLYLSAEDSRNEINLRMQAAMQHHGLTAVDVPGLQIIGAENWGLPLLKSIHGAPVLDERGCAVLAAELDHIQPDVLIIDPLINVMGGVDANNNSAAAVLMGYLARDTATRRHALMIAHHASKGRDPLSAESAMGAASITNLSRIVLSIEPLAEKDAGQIGLPPWEAKSVFRMVGTKQNLSPASKDDRWHRICSVQLSNQKPPIYPHGDNVAVVEQFVPGSSGPAFPADLILAALHAINAADPPLSPSANAAARHAAPAIANAIAPLRGGKSSEVEAKAILDHLIGAGLAEVQLVKIPRPGKGTDSRKGLVLSPAGLSLLPKAPADPQSPQSPAVATAGIEEYAGGDPSCGSPATQGGCGGNAGGKAAGVEPVGHAVPAAASSVESRGRGRSIPDISLSRGEPDGIH